MLLGGTSGRNQPHNQANQGTSEEDHLPETIFILVVFFRLLHGTLFIHDDRVLLYEL